MHYEHLFPTAVDGTLEIRIRLTTRQEENTYELEGLLGRVPERLLFQFSHPSNLSVLKPMGRPPHGGGPVFRFLANEVIEMEACLQEISKFNYSVPSRETICAFAEKFSASTGRSGKLVVQPKQVLNWFQNRRYAHRTKVKEPAKLNVSPMPRDDVAQFRNVAPPISVPQGRNPLENVEIDFEAKSAKDGAWYDVAAFCSHRMIETGNPEVRIRFTGFGEEDEWINVRKSVRQRSLPCEAGECVAVLPGDLVLCFQEGKEHALYFDAHVLDSQRRRHDVRGCRCRFLVRYDHDQSEEIVSLRKICRRPETDYRLKMLPNTTPSGSADARSSSKYTFQVGLSKDQKIASERNRKQRKVMDLSKDEVMTIALPALSPLNVSVMQTGNATAPNDDNSMVDQEAPMNDSLTMSSSTAATAINE